MSELIDLSNRAIDSGVIDGPANRITNELSELGEDLAIVESFSHSVVLRTGDGLVAFDASGPRTGGEVADAVAAWSDQPLTHLVYTHGHIDHVGGSGAMASRLGTPQVIGHENVRSRFDRYVKTNDWNLDINARQFGGIRQDAGLGLNNMDDRLGRWRRFLPEDAIWPDVEVDDRHRVTVGDETIELRHARGETDDHLWAWLPGRKTIMAGDFVIWNFPNAGNPQKVQRYPIEWAAALREMIACEPELLVPAHGLPISGTDRIATVLGTMADALEHIADEVVAMMNGGHTLDEIIHTVRVPDEILAMPFMRPLYDEPEFVVRNVWRQFGGWWDRAASRLKPAPDAEVASVLAEMTGGAGALAARAEAESAAGNHRLASHLADLAGWAAPDDADIHRVRAAVYLARRSDESSLMSKGIYAAAARESEAIAGPDASASD